MRKLKNEELNRLDTASFKNAPKNPVVIVLDNVRSMNNVGAVFRTADAFLAEKIYLCGITAQPPHRDIHKTALGATQTVDWEYFEHVQDAVRHLQNTGYVVIPIEQADESVSLHEFQPDKDHKYAFVLGHEVQGVQDEVVQNAGMCIEIPQYGTKHSLNIAVSAGIMIWDFIAKINTK